MSKSTRPGPGGHGPGAVIPQGTAAAAAIAALVAADTLIAFGGKANVKTTEAATGFGADGYLCRFTTADDPDISSMRDFFTKGTYFGESDKLPVYFHHGLPLSVVLADGTTKTIGPGKHKIGTCSVKSDDTGIFVDAIVDEAGEYQSAIQQLLNSGLLGWSSGSASHLVDREPVASADGKSVKANEIKQWPLAEASLTHTPAEPRNVASAVLTSVKGLLGQYGAYSYDYDGGTGDSWNPVERMGTAAADVLLWRLERAIDNILCDDDLAPTAQIEAINGCFDEAKGLLAKLVEALATINLTSDAAGALDAQAKAAFSKFVPSGQTPETKAAVAALSVSEQGEKAIDALTAYVKRLGIVRTLTGAKSGRTISQANRTRLESARGLIDELLGEESSSDTTAPTETDATSAGTSAVADDSAKNVSLSPEAQDRLAALIGAN